MKTKVVDAGEPSHPAKKLRDDHEAPGGPTVGVKSQSSIQYLFDGTVQNAEVKGGVMPTLPFVMSFVSTTPERVNIVEAEVDSVVRTSVPIITSATTSTTPTVDPAAIAKEKLVGSSVFGADSPSTGESHPIPGGFSDCTGSDFLIGEYNIREIRRLNSVVDEKDALLKAKDEEIGGLKAQLSEVAALKECNNLLETEKSRLDVKVPDLTASVKVMEQKVADLDTMMHKLEASSARLQEKVTDGLSSEITHGVEGRVLTDVAAYNLSAEADYLFALQRLQSVNFSLISKLKSKKDASIDTIMNLLRLEDSLAEKLGLTESQPHIHQLMVPIHLPWINVLSAHCDVFVPLSKPLSATALTGTESTLNVIPATVDTTTALSITLVSTSLIPPISTDDYEIMHAEGEKSVGADANPLS
nr:hypothetical protein [Tanacetum cinerariifolium]